MEEKTLSEEIIGCKNCLGEWIKADKVRKFVKELKEKPKRITYRKWINQLAGDKLI